MPPEDVSRRYAEAGYDFYCLSDHFIGRYGYPIADTRPHRTNRFTTILGAEVHAGAMENGELWHLLAVGLPADFSPPDTPDFLPVPGAEDAASLARRCREAGAFVAIPHPQWSSLTLADALTIEAAHAVEIYNHGSALDSDRGDGTAVLDLLLSKGQRLTACATDDAHFTADDHFGGWVMVKAPSLEPEDLLAALKAGAYYSSQGPEIHSVERVGDTVRVACSRAARVVAVGPGSASASIQESAFEARADGGDVAALPLGRLADAPWFRVTVVDHAGKKAWMNPIWR